MGQTIDPLAEVRKYKLEDDDDYITACSCGMDHQCVFNAEGFCSADKCGDQAIQRRRM